MHAAVLSHADDEKHLAVLKYLLSVFPASIDFPSAATSLTPLALAFLNGRIPAAKTLISAGAGQTTRDSTGKNLIHLSLICISKTKPTDVSKFRDLLALVDKRLLPSLFTERCRDNPGGLTPLAFWLSSLDSPGTWTSRDVTLVPEVFSVMLEFGGADSLNIMDGSGQFPLHQAVKHSYTKLVKLMLAHDPSLSSRENAMGQTPLELAESLYIRDCTSGNPNIKDLGYHSLQERPKKYYRDPQVMMEKKNDVRRTWEICSKCARENPLKRKLISVIEAREVAKRLAERNKEEREKQQRASEGKGKEEEKGDEVSGWLGYDTLRMG